MFIEKENDKGQSINNNTSSNAVYRDHEDTDQLAPLNNKRKHATKVHKERTRSPASDDVPVPQSLLASAEAESLHPLVQS